MEDMSGTDPGDDLRSRAVMALGQMTPRRFDLLVVCCSLPETFTTDALRGQLSEGMGSSLLRDLRALEAGGWLVATPPASEPRQGKVVRYRVTPLAESAWPALHQQIVLARASSSQALDRV